MYETWPATGGAQSERVIDHYRLGRSLGSGSLGEVFEAFDLNTSPPTRVAFKLLHTELATDREAVAELKHEAQILKNLRHPNILPILDFVVKPEAQQVYLVTPYAKGGTLESFFQPNPASDPIPFDCAQLLTLLEPLAHALDYAHANGLVHRDIKPANILLDEDNQPMLTDFSLSLQLNNLTNGTRSKRVNLVKAQAWGTPSYAAPEQWEGKVGWPSDVYSLGVMVYQLLTGHLPYEGTPDQLKVLHKSAPIPKVSDKVPELHHLTGINRVIKAALAKDPANRLRSAGALYEGLRRACETDEEVSLLLAATQSDPQVRLLGGGYLAQWPHDPAEWREVFMPDPFEIIASPFIVLLVLFFLPFLGLTVVLGLIPFLEQGSSQMSSIILSPYFLLWVLITLVVAGYRYVMARRKIQRKLDAIGQVYIGREGVFQFNQFILFKSVLDVKYHQQTRELRFNYKENEAGMAQELITKVPPDQAVSAPALVEFFQQVVIVEQKEANNIH